MPDERLKHLWQVSLDMLYSVIKSAALRRNHVFTLHIIYWSPLKLSKIRGGGDAKCKRCGGQEADDIQIFTTCPALKEFWDSVGKTMSDALGKEVKVRPSLILFGSMLPMGGMERFLGLQYKLVFYLTLLARREICKRWRQVAPPTLNEWWNSVRFFRDLDQKANRLRKKKSSDNFGTYWTMNTMITPLGQT